MAEFSFASRVPFWLHLDNMSSFWPLSPGQIRCNQAYKGPIYSPLLQWMLEMLPVCIFASRWILRHLCQVLEIWAGAQDLCSDIAVTPRLSIMKISCKSWQLHSIITDFFYDRLHKCWIFIDIKIQVAATLAVVISVPTAMNIWQVCLP